MRRRTRAWTMWILRTILYLGLLAATSAGPAAGQSDDDEECLACHDDRTLTAERNGRVLSLWVNPRSFAESVHALEGCVSCHQDVDIDDLPHEDRLENVDCSSCHDRAVMEFQRSLHGSALDEGRFLAPTCATCHGKHDIRRITDPESPMSREHEVEVCLACHLNDEEVQARMTHTSAFVAGYERSVHGRAASTGNPDAPTCSDCHGAHDAMKASNPASPVNKFNLAGTCGNCHVEISAAFRESAHGTAIAQGIDDAPTCTDCHSEHEIIKTDDPDAPVASANVSEAVCQPCHSSYRLSAKYGFPSDRADTFGDSFHGFAARFGETEVANCASCHGVHDILPSRDPRSKVHPDNILVTCGSCHPGANERFAVGAVHIVRTEAGDRLLYWIARVYLIVIIVVIGGMALHNGMDWLRKVSLAYRARMTGVPERQVPSVPGPRKLYMRMTIGERWQHALLAISFILLTITGFMLRYPEAGWVEIFRTVFGGRLVSIRSLVHRGAGAAMLAVSFYHLWYILFTPRGRRFVADIRFRVSDFREIVQSIRWMAGFTDTRPRYDRFNYIEKAEYWALVWGTVVMGATGLVLWFEYRFSKTLFDASETIHLYEAWLAFLAIVVWHIYYVIFNPDVYPMNFTWLTGRVSEEEMEKEHPRELERLKASEGEA